MICDFEELENLYTDLIEKNQYLIKIKGEKNNWVIYLFKNIHIKLDIETNTSITSKNIDIQTLCSFLNDKNNFKIIFKHYNYDLQLYIDTMKNILHCIKMYYNATEKNINIFTKIYCN